MMNFKYVLLLNSISCAMHIVECMERPNPPGVPIPILTSPLSTPSNSPLSTTASSAGSSRSGSPERPQPGLQQMQGRCVKCMNLTNVVKPFVCTHRYCHECDQRWNRNGCDSCQQASRDCVICFEELTRDTKRSLVCNHYYCIACITGWERTCEARRNEKTCPMCRGALEYKISYQCELCHHRFTDDDEVSTHVCVVPHCSFEILKFKTPPLYTEICKHWYHDRCLQGDHIYRQNERGAVRDNGNITSYPCPQHPEVRHNLRQDATVRVAMGPPPANVSPRTAEEIERAIHEADYEERRRLY